MNKCILQFWEESERGFGTRPDGCSIHLNIENLNKFRDIIYGPRQSHISIPDEYERIVGNPIECFISDNLFEKLLLNDIRVSEVQKNNLISMNEIIFKPE